MNILLVEDEVITRKILEEQLTRWGYTVWTAADGESAWEVLQAESVDLVLADWVMPGISGLELCERIRNAQFHRYIYLILVSSRDSPQSIVEGLEGGVDDYIVKPPDMAELKARLAIGTRIIKLERDLRFRYQAIQRNYHQTIRMFTNLIEVYDNHLGGHCQRVAQMAVAMAQRLPQVPNSALRLVESASLLHDIGLVGMPKRILLKKKTEMNSEERQLFMAHPVQGELILKEIEFLAPIARLVRAHHEQFNGLGFPDGLKGRRIPLLARVISGASMYDNLVYRGKVALEEVSGHLARFRGYQLDPAIVEVMLELNEEAIREEACRQYWELSLDDLKPGMVLERAVRMKTGVLVMPAATELTGTTIEKLKNYHKMNCMTDKLYIRKQ